MKRSILIEGIDKELVLSKVVEIDTQLETINLEKLNDGTWRMIYSKSVIPEIKEVTGFKIIRENEEFISDEKREQYDQIYFPE